MRQAEAAVNASESGRPADSHKSPGVRRSIDGTVKRMHTSRPMVAEESRLAGARRNGRRAGIAVFSLIMVIATASWTYQILRAVFTPPILTVATECRTGTRGLLVAVRRARVAAASESGDERAALSRFRAALEPEWDSRASLESVCGSDAKTRGALAEIDALRYAEEHAVRYEAVGLAPQRRRVQALYETLFERDGQPSPALP